MERMNNLLLGGGGIALVDTTPDLINVIAVNAPSVVQMLVQIVIGIVTIIGIFKKKKLVNP
jgi:hypothetical protein